MGMSSTAYREQLRALLPRGPALDDGGQGTLTDLLDALAQEFERVDASGDVLLAEAQPATTSQLLPDWERIAGLPSPCTPSGQTDDERRAALQRRLAANAPQTVAWILALAESLGYTVSIVERRTYRCGGAMGAQMGAEPWQFVWECHHAGTPVTSFWFDDGHCGDAFGAFGDATMECRLNERPQSHTQANFCYDWAGYNLFRYREIGRLFLPVLGALYQDAAGTEPVTAAGQTVVLIKDLSGNGQDVTLAGGAGCTFEYDAAGNPCLVNAGDSWYSGSDAGLPTGNADAHLAVCAAWSEPANNATLLWYGAVHVHQARYLGLDASAPQKIQSSVNALPPADIVGAVPIAARPYVIEQAMESQTEKLYIDGVLQGSYAPGLGAQTTLDHLGLMGGAGPGFAGTFYGAVVYAGASWPRSYATRWLGALAAETFPGYDLLLLNQAFARAGTAGWTDPSGLLQTAAAGNPRNQNDPALGPLGLWIEGARTNQLASSNDFTAPSWVNEGNVTITPNAAIGPDGQMSLTKMTVVTTANPHIWNNAYVLGNPAPATIIGRIWLRAGSVDTFRVRCNQPAAVVSAARIVQGPGSIKSQGTSDGSVIVEGLQTDQLTLLEFWTTGALAASTNFVTSLHFDYGSANDWGVGDYIFFGFEQLEEADFATTYIECAGAATARPADDAAFDASWVATERCCVWGEFVIPVIEATQRVWALAFNAAPNGGGANYFGLHAGVGGQLFLRGRLANVQYNDVLAPAGTVVAGQVCKFCAALADDTWRLSIDGAAPLSAAQVQALPVSPDQWYLGSLSGADYLFGGIAKCRTFPFAPTDAQMQQLSS